MSVWHRRTALKETALACGRTVSLVSSVLLSYEVVYRWTMEFRDSKLRAGDVLFSGTGVGVGAEGGFACGPLHHFSSGSGFREEASPLGREVGHSSHYQAIISSGGPSLPLGSPDDNMDLVVPVEMGRTQIGWGCGHILLGLCKPRGTPLSSDIWGVKCEGMRFWGPPLLWGTLALLTGSRVTYHQSSPVPILLPLNSQAPPPAPSSAS